MSNNGQAATIRSTDKSWLAHKHEAERYLPTLSAVIARSQIVVMLPDAATAQRLPANFDAVDIAILEWIAAEGRRLAPVYLLIRH